MPSSDGEEFGLECEVDMAGPTESQLPLLQAFWDDTCSQPQLLQSMLWISKHCAVDLFSSYYEGNHILLARVASSTQGTLL